MSNAKDDIHYSKLGRMSLCGRDVTWTTKRKYTDEVSFVTCPDCLRRWKTREDRIKAQKAK